MVLATTCTFTVAFAVPAVAVSVARPGATAVMTPCSARTTPGALDVHWIGSTARSLAREYPTASTRACCPTTSFAGATRISTRAAGAGMISSSRRSTTGLEPATVAMATIGILPMALATTLPVESIAPDPPPPNRILAFCTTPPLASYACAVNCTVSPARTVRVAGEMTTRETAVPCGSPACWASRRSANGRTCMACLPLCGVLVVSIDNETGEDVPGEGSPQFASGHGRLEPNCTNDANCDSRHSCNSAGPAVRGPLRCTYFLSTG